MPIAWNIPEILIWGVTAVKGLYFFPMVVNILVLFAIMSFIHRVNSFMTMVRLLKENFSMANRQIEGFVAILTAAAIQLIFLIIIARAWVCSNWRTSLA